MLPTEVLRTVKPGQVIKTQPLLPKVSPEPLRFKVVKVTPEDEGRVRIEFHKTYFDVHMGTASVTLAADGAMKWQL